MRELLDRAELAELQLRGDIARLRLQADDVESASAGALGQLPRGELQTSREAIRQQAMENARPGLCDDPVMQDTIACPLDDALRSSNRELVKAQLDAIAEHWHSAVLIVHTEERYKKALASIGASSVRDMLLNLAGGWLGGALVGFAMSKAMGGYAAKAAMRSAVFSLEELKEAFKGLGKKGGEKVAAKLPKPATHDNLEALIQSCAELVTAWRTTVTSSIRHLPDAALTALASGLKSSPFTVGYFSSRLKLLLARFGELEKSMGRSGWAAAQTTTVWVVHPKGGGRMALAREEEEEKRHGHGKASDVVTSTTGRYVFKGWVDRSLESVALDIGRQRNLNTLTALTTTDSRWVDPGAPALAEWHASAAARDDVAMFDEGGK